MIMKIHKWRNRNVIAFFIIYWLVLSLNAIIANKLELPSIIEWWINTAIILSVVLLCVLTYRTKIKILYQIIFIPISWFAHAVLTASAAFVMGIIRLDPNHIRTNGEHRAIFILASLPVLFFALSKSKLFVEEVLTKKSIIK